MAGCVGSLECVWLVGGQGRVGDNLSSNGPQVGVLSNCRMNDTRMFAFLGSQVVWLNASSAG